MKKAAPIALVTGGAHRVGRAISLALASAGWNIAITYHQSRDEAQSLLQEISRLGRRAIAVSADLSRGAAAIPKIISAARRLGRVQVLVNNASIYLPDSTTASAHRMWQIHVESPLLLCRALAPDLRHRGRVINMLDMQAQKPRPRYAAYCASKAALWNLTLYLARELAPHTTVNGIAPGVVLWPKNYPPSQKAAYLRQVPLARAGTPQDVAKAVLFLCRDADYITGQILFLDGGRSLV